MRARHNRIPSTFVEWTIDRDRKAKETTALNIAWNELVRRKQNPQTEVSKLLQDGTRFSLIIDSRDETGEISLKSGRTTAYAQLIELIITDDQPSIMIENVNINRLIIRSKFSQTVQLKRCYIGDIVIEENAESKGCDVNLISSWIEKITLNQGSCDNILIVGGGIVEFSVPSPSMKSPLRGDFALYDVWLPTEAVRTKVGFFDRPVTFPASFETTIQKNLQASRNLRSHLLNLNNISGASSIHEYELCLERRYADHITRFINAVYATLADGGFSISKPLIFLSLLFFVPFVFYGIFDAGAVVRSDAASAGFRHLLNDAQFAPLLKAFFLSGSSIVNPLGLFGGQSLVVPRTVAAGTVQLVQGILSPILFALLVVGLRRRFRIYSNQ